MKIRNVLKHLDGQICEDIYGASSRHNSHKKYEVFYIPLNCMAVYTSVYSVYNVKMKKTVCINTHTQHLSLKKRLHHVCVCVCELMLSAGLHTPAGIANSPAPLESRQIRCNLRCVFYAQIRCLLSHPSVEDLWTGQFRFCQEKNTLLKIKVPKVL